PGPVVGRSTLAIFGQRVRNAREAGGNAGLVRGIGHSLWAAVEQGIGLGYQVDSSPLTVDGIKITNVEGEGCGTCNIAEALKMS
ncbi:hypothetical protein FRD81_21945, partial [Mycobacterium tuberculosis]|uniref:hypothetical protein n=1 Tax=Mycobacterium tuberculosis TaxID=1773 RepID=UPI0011B9C373